MANNKVIFGNTTIMDITDTTATEDDVAEGVVFYKADGTRSVGTMASSALDLLWTNSAPTATFNAQTISLDLSAYKAVLITFRIGNTTALAEMQNGIFIVGETTSMGMPFGINRGREVTVSTTGVTFGQGYGFATYANNTKTNSGGNAIPQKIYGLK